jgi:hypothetical protein
MPPKRQRGAALDTDFQYVDFLIFERMQMAFVVTQEIDPNRAFLRALEKPDNIERGIVVHAATLYRQSEALLCSERS